jgi:hypothetical protein
VLAAFKTQREAIEWARKNNHSPLVARVRHLNDKKIPGPRSAWRASVGVSMIMPCFLIGMKTLA